MEPARPARDGRRAYQLLFKFYVDHDRGMRLANQAKDRLASLAYGSRVNEAPPPFRPRVHFRSFDQYVTAHMKQHRVLDALERWGHPPGVYLSQRICYFMDGMFIHPSVKEQVEALQLLDPSLDFNALVHICRRVVGHRHEQVESQISMTAAPSYGANSTNRKKKRRTYN